MPVHVAGGRVRLERRRDHEAADDDEREDEAQKQRQVARRGGEVEARAGDDEEHRLEEAVGYDVDLLLQGLAAVGEERPQDEAGRKGAERRVELEHRGREQQEHQKQDDEPHEGLAGAAGVFHQEAAEAAAAVTHLRGQQVDSQTHEHEGQKQHSGARDRARGQQERHGEDGQDLAQRAVDVDGLAHARAPQTSVMHDGRKRAVRGGRHADGERHPRRLVEAEPREHERHDGEPQAERHQPRAGGVGARASQQVAGVDLVAGFQEEEAHAEVGEELNRLEVGVDAGQPELSADGAAKHKEHDLGHRATRDEARHERRHHGHQEDGHKRVVDFRHDGTPHRKAPRAGARGHGSNFILEG